MCTRYVSPEVGDIERAWHICGRNTWRGGELFPRSQGPFIRAAREESEPQREFVVGQWGLIPWFAKAAKLTYSTVNARSEELASKASYKHPWQYGKRCIIPASWFYEPNWETGKNQWWQFKRTDGEPLGLAGIWNTWTDKATGQAVESYSMLTINADAHPLMRRMHKPDPKLGPNEQDKRSVIPIEIEDVDLWLFGTQIEARQLLRVPGADAFNAEPIVL